MAYSMAVVISSSFLLVSLLIGAFAAFAAYGAARRFEARSGVGAWHLPAGVWAFIFFLSWLIGLLLFVIAKATTKPRQTTPVGGIEPPYPVEPAPMAGWYPDPGGHHELRYWDGKGWTAHVRDGAIQGTDPD